MKMQCKFLTYILISFFSAIATDVMASGYNSQLYNSVELRDDMTIKTPPKGEITKLIKKGADPNYKDLTSSNTVLDNYLQQIAYSYNQAEYKAGLSAISELLKNGAKPTEKSLYYPISKNQIDLVILLHKNGASLSKWDNYRIGTKLSPIEQADAFGFDNITNYIASSGIARPDKLISRSNRIIATAGSGTLNELVNMKITREEVNSTGSYGYTPLYACIQNYSPLSTNSRDKISYLFSLGADANFIDANGTPLISTSIWKINQEAELHKSTSIFKLFTDNKVNLNAQDSSKNTALHTAAKYGLSKTVELLLANNASIRIENKDGMLAFDLSKNDEIKALFRNYGFKEPPTIETFEFRGFKFRSSNTDHNLSSETELKKKHNVKLLYECPDIEELWDKAEKKKIGDASISDIKYLNYKDKLFTIYITYPDNSYHDSTEIIRAALEKKYNITMKKPKYFDLDKYDAKANGIEYTMSCSKSFTGRSVLDCYLMLIDIDLRKEATDAETNYTHQLRKSKRENASRDM